MSAAPKVGRKRAKLLADERDEDAGGEAGQYPIEFFLIAFSFMSVKPLQYDCCTIIHFT